MALTFSDKPQLLYGNQRRSTLDEIRERFPPEMRSMESAPSMGSTPVWVFEANGQPYFSIHHRGQWQKMGYETDNRTGATSFRMLGESLSHPVGWIPATKENMRP